MLDQIYVTKSKVMQQRYPQYSMYDSIAYEFSRVVETRGSSSIFQVSESQSFFLTKSIF